jgi:hypothetical protein
MCLLVGALTLSLTGCPDVDIDDPAQAVSNAEIAGNLAVFTYFAADKEAAKNAQKYLAAIETLEANIAGPPGDGGFASLTDLVHSKLEERLVGEDAAFLPGAKSLSRILLLKMDQEIKLPKVEPSEDLKVLLDIVKAFLRGARTSLKDFIPT